MTPEVRYHMLRPQQVIARRKECPVVYIPLGILEWHGVQSPLGADALQAEDLCLLCAQRGGGLVFPPLYYGETRLEAMMEVVAPYGDEIARAMELPPDNFSARYQPGDVMEQRQNYERLLLHILAEADTLGFKVGVLVCGHNGLIGPASAVAERFNQREPRCGMVAWACVDYRLVLDRWPDAGDHGGGWETSHLLATRPETVDLGLLPAKGEPLVGLGFTMAPQDSTAQFGHETYEATADAILREVERRMQT